MFTLAPRSPCVGLACEALALATFLIGAGGCTDDDSPSPLPVGYGDGLTGRAFQAGSTHHTLADLQTVQLKLTFDPIAHTTVGHAEVQFRPVETGEPFFLLTPKATAATLDGKPVQLTPVQAPDDPTVFTSIATELTAGTDHALEIEYPLDAASYPDGGVELLTSMLDVQAPDAPAHFFEHYGPSSIEADQFQLSVELEVVHGTAPQIVFSNGTQHEIAPGHFTIEFPAYFSTSSFYFHLTIAGMPVRQTTYRGLDHEIPITVYGDDADDIDQAIASLPSYFADLEATFGPYPHAAFVANVSRAAALSMEHAGATVTHLFDLSHELCHSWFGRGVLPADGRSGWIDEAVCSWRDTKYDPVDPAPNGRTNLAWYSMWALAPVLDPHGPGAGVLAHVDSLLAGRGGLRPVLAKVFAQWNHQPITTEQFLEQLATETGLDLDDYMQARVYGGHPPPR